MDITHQFKAAGVVDLPFGFTISSTLVAHSGLAFPTYDLVDANGDGVTNQFANNDRPTVTIGGKSFLLPRYPGRQPNSYQWDMRIKKDLRLTERYHVQFLVDFFNLTNRGNLFSNSKFGGFVDDLLTAIPKPGDVSSAGTVYRTLDQIAPGSTPFAAQVGAKFVF